MNKLKIVTDSNSGILQKEGEDLGIFVIPMPFTIDDEEYLEEISISQEQFYEFLKKDADVKTSQPSQYYLEELWNNLLKENNLTVDDIEGVLMGLAGIDHPFQHDATAELLEKKGLRNFIRTSINTPCH